MIPLIIAAIETPEDRDLMTEFFLQTKDLMYTEAAKLIPAAADAEDIVCEALAKIIDKMDVFRQLQPKQQVSYALVCIRNLSYNHLHSSNRTIVASVDAIEQEFSYSNTCSAEKSAEKNLRQVQIRQVWQELDMESRTLLEQKYELQWSDTEIARQLGIQPQSVRMRLTCAKRKLMAALQEKGLSLADF